MSSNQQGEELRRELAQADRSGVGRPYPEALRRAAVEYGRQRERQGASVGVVAAELGVSGVSLSRWLRKGQGVESGFRAIEVVAEPYGATARRLVVHGPRGLRIEGLTVLDVVTLLERLS
jgi:transposase